MIMPNEVSYYRIMLGKGSVYAQAAHDGDFIGSDFSIDRDLTSELREDWREFNQKFIPLYLEKNSDKTKVAAGLRCGSFWTIAKGMRIGDVVLCPNGHGSYLVGEVSSEYFYKHGEILPHRRSVRWYADTIGRAQMSEPLRNSTGAIGTVSNVTRYADEIRQLIVGDGPQLIVATDETIEDPSIFALEKHLEDFLIQNWSQTELGKGYDIFEEDGQLAGQQYPTDTGPIDILAISKDKKQLLVVELKKGRASDAVVGQIQRYMGYVKDELVEVSQTVKGVIIALESDIRLKRALSVTTNIEFYTYQVNFKLLKGGQD